MDGVTSIDFLKLLHEEKRKARESRKRHPDRSLDHPPSNSQQAIKPENDSNTSIESAANPKDWSNEDWLGPSDLTGFDAKGNRVGSNVLDSVYYVPRYLEGQKQQNLMKWLQRLPVALFEGEPGSWNSMKHAKRRVALFDANQINIAPPLRLLCNTFVSNGIFPDSHPPNHVLINEYEAGQGIMPHTDGPLYFPTTATLSIGGSDVLFKFTKRLKANEIGVKDNPTILEVRLSGNGSLVVFRNKAYTSYHHRIDSNVSDEQASNVCVNAVAGETIQRGYRLSLTFRHKYQIEEIDG